MNEHIDEKLIQKLKSQWRNCNRGTIEFASSVGIKSWNQKSFKNRFSRFSWEFACITRTRYCYIDGLKNGKLTFSEREGIPNKSSVELLSKSEIINLLNLTAKEILKQIEDIDSIEKVDFMISLLNHERIHQGKLILLHSNSGLKISDSFRKTWGESNFSLKTNK